MIFTDHHKRDVYVLLCLGCITISFNVAAISAAIPLMSADLQLTDLGVARVIPYYMVPYGLGALLYAPLTRVQSYRTVLRVSLLLYAFACLACARIQTLPWFLAARICMGVTAAGAIPLGLMMIGDFFRREIRGRLVGVFFSCSFFASLAGVICMGFLHWRWLFYVPAGMGVLLALALCLSQAPILDRRHVEHVNYWHALQKDHIRPVFLFIFAISFLYHGVHKWFGVYLHQEYGQDQLGISLFFVVGAIGGFIGQLLGGYISDKKGRLVACGIGSVGLALGIMALIGHYPLILLGLLMGLISMCWTMGHNGISTILTDFADQDRPVIASLNSSVRFISGGLGFYVSRWFVAHDFGLTFLSMGGLMLILTLFIKKIIPE